MTMNLIFSRTIRRPARLVSFGTFSSLPISLRYSPGCGCLACPKFSLTVIEHLKKHFDKFCIDLFAGAVQAVPAEEALPYLQVNNLPSVDYQPKFPANPR